MTSAIALTLGLVLTAVELSPGLPAGGSAVRNEGSAGDSTRLRVASCSVMPSKWDKTGNADKVERAVRNAAAQGAELIVTPEGVLEGYVENLVIYEKDPQTKEELTRRFNEMAEPVDGPYIARFRRLADELNVYLI